jgi:hypothetical protein
MLRSTSPKRELEDRSFVPVRDVAPERDWIDCKVSEGRLRGAGGPAMLGRILRTFLDWARQAQGESRAAAG